MNVERLTQLRDLLLTVPEEKFNMSYWIKTESTPSDLWEFAQQCGTAACAGGLACLYKPFQEQGLRLVEDAPTIMDNDGWMLVTGYSALSLFFDIQRPTTYWLFNPEEYYEDVYDSAELEEVIGAGADLDKRITPEHVVGRINKLLGHPN